MKVLGVFLSCFVLGSCQYFFDSSEGNAVARVGEEYLYQNTIIELTKSVNQEDSAEIAESYIQNWIREQLLIQKALQNLGEEQLNFEQQLRDYRNSLIIYAYQNELVKQKLDTNVSQADIEAYYNEFNRNFVLKTDIARYQLIKTKFSAPQQDSIKLWMQTPFDETKESIRNYCLQFAEKCLTNPEQWLSVNSLMEHLPLSAFNELESALNYNGYKSYTDSTVTSHLNLIEVKKQGELAPISYVRAQIKDIIINKRRLELLANVSNEIYEEGTLKNKYETYY